MKTVTTEEQIESVLDYFDFEKVHKAMVALNWRWVGVDDGIPTIGHLRQKARKMLREVIVIKKRSKSSSSLTATGGLQASIDSDNCLELEFVVSNWCGYDSFCPDLVKFEID